MGRDGGRHGRECWTIFKLMPMEDSRFSTVESRFELDCTHLVPPSPFIASCPGRSTAQHSKPCLSLTCQRMSRATRRWDYRGDASCELKESCFSSCNTLYLSHSYAIRALAVSRPSKTEISVFTMHHFHFHLQHTMTFLVRGLC